MSDTYHDVCGDPRDNAQSNLWGRSHYCDNDTLRFHKSRITHCEAIADGQYLMIVEAYAVDYCNTRRAFRGVIFDTNGHTVYRPGLESGFASTATALKHARKAMAAIEEGVTP